MEQKYLDEWQNCSTASAVTFLKDNAKNYIKELDEIENRKPVYNQEFWEKVKVLNAKDFDRYNLNLRIHDPILWFIYSNDHASSTKFEYNEFNLVNEQYRLLQIIHNSRGK